MLYYIKKYECYIPPWEENPIIIRYMVIAGDFNEQYGFVVRNASAWFSAWFKDNNIYKAGNYLTYSSFKGNKDWVIMSTAEIEAK